MCFLWICLLQWTKTHLATLSLVVALSIGCMIHWILNKYCPSGKRLPPGPWLRLPYVGYLPFLGTDFIKGFTKLQKKYGPVYRLRLGQRSVLVLNDFSSVKEAFSQRAFLGRPPNPPNHLQQGVTSFSVNSGIIWQEQKRFALHVFRDLGFGKTRMETLIKEEIALFVEEMKSFKGRPVYVRRYLAPSTSNNVGALIFGRRLGYRESMSLTLDRSIMEMNRFFRPTSVHTWFPWLKKLLFRFKLWDYDKLENAINKVMDFAEKEIDEHQVTLDPNLIRDYIDGFLLEMEQRQYKDPNTSFTRGMLKGNTSSLIGAGSTTVSATVQWCLLTMAAYPEVQKRVLSEMDEVIGRERTPLWTDHVNLPYTEAVLMEVQRWKTVVPINLLRFTTETSEVSGFYIPEGMTVIANIYAVHNDPAHWENPGEFRPERFLTPDGKVLKDEQWIPFSLGKRSCPGETLASVEVFLYVTSLVQKFQIEFPEGKTHSLEGNIGATFEPKPYELCMIPRRQ